MTNCRCQKCMELEPEKYVQEICGVKIPFFGMIVCQICGNKRCPHATDHNNACTNSNEPGQKGSAYE